MSTSKKMSRIDYIYNNVLIIKMYMKIKVSNMCVHATEIL